MTGKGGITRIIGKRGNTTIPYVIRLKLGVRPGDVIRYVITDEENILIERFDLTQASTSEDIFNEIMTVFEELFASCTEKEKLKIKEFVNRL